QPRPHARERGQVGRGRGEVSRRDRDPFRAEGVDRARGRRREPRQARFGEESLRARGRRGGVAGSRRGRGDRAQRRSEPRPTRCAPPRERPRPPPELRVTLDGVAISSGAFVDVDAGSHTVAATAPAFTQFETTIKIANGEQREVETSLTTLAKRRTADS